MGSSSVIAPCPLPALCRSDCFGAHCVDQTAMVVAITDRSGRRCILPLFAQMIRAVLLACATAATLKGGLARSAFSQGRV
jgi:hypothetical protein